MATNSIAKILIVDDEVDVLSAFVRIHSSPDIEILRALNGAQATEIAQEQRPRLALIDLLLRDEMGSDLIWEIRKVSPKTTIAIISNLASAPAQLAVQLVGVAFLNKPIGREQVMTLLALGDSEEAQRAPRPFKGWPLDKMIQHHVQSTLDECDGVKAKAARVLSIHRNRLDRILAWTPIPEE